MSKLENRSISRQKAKFISNLLDKIDLFYKTYDGFRDIYPIIFDIEKSNVHTFTNSCEALSSYNLNNDEKEFILVLLLDLIYFDGSISPKEDSYMEKLAVHIGVGLLAYRNLKNLYNVRANQSNSNNNKSNNDYGKDSRANLSLDEAYEILNATPSDTNEEIKRKYRELVQQYHYDKLHSKDLPPDLIKFAQEKLKEINLAYEIIKKHRGI
ncbi:DnaJ domain-containing protein [Campylobacter geochelonis]|uniref:DnaJ domain-containing protein n=1 Tax=Campylobacter geochelonis TaxID=1780362 RepID=UPI000770838C|nr:DnaJ domain-containing protein [Campylobacter geochelonis]CZE50786.1 DnaJ domain-containing protein [Campylobacter geochelonis]